MNDSRKGRNSDVRPWAPPRVGVPVERRDPWEVAMHGARAGLLAGAKAMAMTTLDLLANPALVARARAALTKKSPSA